MIEFITRREGRRQASVSRTTEFRLVREDPTWPKPVQITRGRSGYVASEIQKWIAARIAQRDETLGDAVESIMTAQAPTDLTEQFAAPAQDSSAEEPAAESAPYLGADALRRLVRDRMRDRGLTQVQFAELVTNNGPLKLSQPSLSQFLAGKTNLSDAMRAQIEARANQLLESAA